MSEVEAGSDRSSGTILRRTARGAGWIIAWRGVTRLLGFMNTLILARLLVPADFGLVALGTGIAGSLQALSALGIEQALVREAGLDRALYDTGFTLNVLRGCGTAALLGAAAWPAAAFFGDPRLVTVMLVLAVCTLAGGFSNIGVVDYLRTLDFKKEFVLASGPRLASVLATLIIAAVWRSYWALLGGIIVARLLGVLLSYVMHPYRPVLHLSRWRYLAGFSFWTWAIVVAQAARDRVATFLIGRYLGESEVATYSVGFELATLPISEILAPIGRACFAGFAASRHDGSDPAAPFLRVMALTTLISLPAAVGISAVAGPIEQLLLGPKWAAAVPVIQVLGLLSFTAAIWLLSEMLLSAHGLLTTMFRLSVSFAVMRVVALILVVPAYGMMGTVYAFGIAAMIEHVFWIATACRHLRITTVALLAQIWRPLLASGGMALLLIEAHLGWTVPQTNLWHAAEALGLSACLGGLSYSGLLLGLWMLAGSPRGAELDTLAVLRDNFGRLAGRRVPALR